MLARRMDLALAAERLGHSTANVTLGIYRHLLQEEKHTQVWVSCSAAHHKARTQRGSKPKPEFVRPRFLRP